jgi:hypothetical protein
MRGFQLGHCSHIVGRSISVYSPPETIMRHSTLVTVHAPVLITDCGI